MPFGFAVVPLVYMRKSRSSLAIGSHGHDTASSGSPLELVPPVVAALLHRHVVAGAPQDDDARHLRRFAIASSAVRFSGTVVPRRHASSCVISTSQPMSTIRPESESAEKPPKTTVCGAPSRVHASIATGSSGTMPM